MKGTVRTPFMTMLHGFFDESGKQGDHEVVAFAGVCGNEPQLERFSEEWKKLLRFYDLKCLHMKEMVRLSKRISSKISPAKNAEEREQHLRPFADCINDYLEIGLIQAWDVKGFQAIPKSIRFQLGDVNDPYFMAFSMSMNFLVDQLPGEEKIGVICDHDQSTALTCLKHFNGVRTADNDIRKRIISLTFADDEFFPALQAADMIAALVRLEALRLFYRKPNTFKALLEYAQKEKGPGKMRWIPVYADQAGLAAICAEKGMKLEIKP